METTAMATERVIESWPIRLLVIVLTVLACLWFATLPWPWNFPPVPPFESAAGVM